MADITDADLMAYVDGDVSPDAAAEIERSPELLARARELAQMEAGLRARLYRADCPDPHQLGEYHLGLLAASQASSIRQHLGRCPHCSAELRQLEVFLAPGLLERARVVVARLLSGGAPARLQPAAGLRGSETVPLVYAAGSRQIILEIQPEAGRPERRSLAGMIVGSADDAAGDALAGVEIHLLAGGQPAASARTGEVGEFAFSGLAPGEYALRLYFPGEEIQVPPFTLE